MTEYVLFQNRTLHSENSTRRASIFWSSFEPLSFLSFFKGFFGLVSQDVSFEKHSINSSSKCYDDDEDEDDK